jgi:hypothetical protein
MLPADFACGYQWYLDSLPAAAETVPRIVVTVLVAGNEITALLDTGANQCILEWALAEQLNAPVEARVVQIRALGGNVHQGILFSTVITFLADEGESVSLEVAAWSAETFTGPNLIGYGGVLERVRIALDPATNRFFFGHP